MKKQIFSIVVASMALVMFITQPVQAATQMFSEPSGNSWIGLRNSSNNSYYYLHNSGDGANLEFAASDINGQTHWQMLNLNRGGNIRMGYSGDPVRLETYGDKVLFYDSAGNDQLNLDLINKITYANSNFWVDAKSGGFMMFSVAGAKKVKFDTTGLWAREIRVNNTWADYVFEDDYKLRPLNEVESFIKENKHLPNIPSAETIEKENLNIGEMQRLQMEKIEELTLYIIQLEKRIGELEKRI